MDWKRGAVFLKSFIPPFVEKRQVSGFDVLKIDVPIGADEKTEWKVCTLQLSPYYLTR